MSSPVICQIPKNVIYFVIPIAIQFEKLNNDLKMPRFIECIDIVPFMISVDLANVFIMDMVGNRIILSTIELLYFTGLILVYNLMKIKQFMMIALN